MISKTLNLIGRGTVLILACALSSCGAKHDAKSITKSYCRCVEQASGILDKAKCLSEATSEYTEALKSISSDELSDFKKGYKEGLKACK